jgi:hypothetical protein
VRAADPIRRVVVGATGATVVVTALVADDFTVECPPGCIAAVVAPLALPR